MAKENQGSPGLPPASEAGSKTIAPNDSALLGQLAGILGTDNAKDEELDGGASDGVAGDGAQPDAQPDEDGSEVVDFSTLTAEDEVETPEDETDEENQDAEGEKPELSKGIQKRIDRLTAQKQELKDKLAAAERERDEMKGQVDAAAAGKVVLSPTPSDPLADVMTPQDLQAKVKLARDVRDWCIENADGADIPDGNGGTVELSAQDVARRKAIADDILHVHAPAREQWLGTRNEAIKVAKVRYSELFKPDSKWSAFAAALTKEVPGLLNLPDRELVLGDLITGYMVRSGKLHAVKAVNGKTAKPAVSPAPPAPRVNGTNRVTGKEVTAESARQRLAKTGSDKAALELISSIL